ncbi:rod shape-determining protein MreC [filamentous cyanobacterium CCP5]|nr:rod shape-determining protein MreC [filamentous cyanobacterium CCP5]
MFALRRWWNRHALQAGLTALAVGAAWAVYETNGVIIYEAYHWVTRPLQPGMSKQQQFENSYTLELQQRIVELEAQNDSLRSLVEYEDSQPDSAIAATVIGRSADHWWQQITVNRGGRDGVKPGYVVTGPGGLVGRVVQVSPSSSQILLVSDVTSRVGGKVSRSRVMGYVRGQIDNRVTMEFFERSPDVKIGDVVVTSDYSRLFPRDIPIGRIEALDLSRSPAPEATIVLSSPLTILEWVVIHPFTPKDTVDSPDIPDLVEPELP